MPTKSYTIDKSTEVLSNSDRYDNVVQPEEEPISWRFWRKRRYVVVFMTCLGFFNIYTLRVNLSVAIVAMTEIRNITDENGMITGTEQYFDWDTKDQGLILSSFFYGYIVTMFLGGYVSNIFGANRVFGVGIFATAVLTLFTPLAATGGVYVFMAIRIVEGFFEGVTFPCCHGIYSRWAPPHERTRMTTLTYTGLYVGTVLGMPLSGVIAEHLGWESVFYVFGVIGVIWYIAWVIIVRTEPKDDKYISKDELRYIQESLENASSNKKIKHPWKSIFLSKPVYAICAAHTAENWGFYTLITQLPTLLKDTMHYSLQTSGLLSAAPYLTMGILMPVFGYLADICIVKRILSTTKVRKYFTCLAFIAQTVFMLLVAIFFDPVWSVVCLILAVGIGGIAWCGFMVNHLDIAPQHASVLMGIGNTFATIPGIVSPTLTGYIVQNKTAEEWSIVFYISASIYFVGCIIYACWGSGELQPWAKKETEQLNTYVPNTNSIDNINKECVNSTVELKNC